MAGIYIHIPFCKQACHYCDFHFSTTLNSKPALLSALKQELILRKDEVNEPVKTIYLGGGTPSLLNADELNQLFSNIKKHYSLLADAEITLEANPDDLSKNYLNQLKHTPVNRLSIGIQSFRDEDLQFMNRAHNASEAIESVKNAAEAGFNNLTLDLIYGVPGLDESAWINNLEKAISLPVNHLSAYCLTVEQGTALSYKINKGLVPDVNDEMAAKHFNILLEMTEKAGIQWYEISNFARPGFESKHNTSYWRNDAYLGIGPSAHSFNGNERSWNVRNNQQYIKSIAQNILPSEKEVLTINQRINEIILTGLRTRKGLTLQAIRNIQPEAAEKVKEQAVIHIENRKLQLKEEVLTLTSQGLLFADAIAADLFI